MSVPSWPGDLDITEGSFETHEATGWAAFDPAIAAVFSRPGDHPDHRYIWRGQARPDWSLSASLDRQIQSLNLPDDTNSVLDLRRRHLDTFKAAARGRRGANPPAMEDNTWWALGQHYGLSTPLLDWTRSPYAAAYFAFADRSASPLAYRAIYCLDVFAVEQKNREINEAQTYEREPPPILEIFEPMSDENPRLVSQGGLFTKAPPGLAVEEWVNGAFSLQKTPVLTRILVTESSRLDCLRFMHRANVSHLSLFPDLAGASGYANLRLELGPRGLP